MAPYVFKYFEEVKENITQIAPKIVYKYRSDWNNEHDKKFIIEQSIWFAFPRQLNDLYDIRIPMQFDIAEIDNPIFLALVREACKSLNPNIAYTEQYFNIICENKIAEIRKDPKSYFENNYEDIREGPIFDTVGLFSCTPDGLNETMWAHYGNNHSGFAVGFNTIELARNLMDGAFGPVMYSDEIPVHSFLNSIQNDNLDIFYLKSKKWDYEKEFRFISFGIEKDSSRIKKYTINSVIEFLIGSKFPELQINGFVTQIRKIFPNNIPIYQVKPKVSAFGLEKIKIN